jgi:hypothetical protein
MMTQSGFRTAGGYAPTLRGRNAVRSAMDSADPLRGDRSTSPKVAE